MSAAVSSLLPLPLIPSSSTLLCWSSSSSPNRLHTRTIDAPISRWRWRRAAPSIVALASSGGRVEEADEDEDEDEVEEVAPRGRKAAFLDEEGMVVNDMDAYLNRLSLEYDSVWDTKPSWCQPWTIVLTGITLTGFSWPILHSTPVTAFVFSVICAWWYLFLYIYPKEYAEMIAERRRNVTAGVEDTFGVRKDQ